MKYISSLQIVRGLVLATLTALSVTAPVSAAKITSTAKNNPAPILTGNDISWPQCGRALPSGQAFGIVGVNGGLATTTNTCLGTQLAWAKASSGTTAQPKIQLYVNTANPGGLGTVSWPQNNVDPAGTAAPNPKGTCDGTDSLACAWQYGWNRAVQDVRDRLSPAAPAAGVSANAADYTWWLDVETENTWKTGSSFAQASNVADLEGMTTYFKSVGANVGIYSTSYQWGQIVGKAVPAGSNLNGLSSWLAGSRNLAAAKTNCSLPALTTGGKVALTQYISGSFDYDYSCL